MSQQNLANFDYWQSWNAFLQRMALESLLFPWWMGLWNMSETKELHWFRQPLTSWYVWTSIYSYATLSFLYFLNWLVSLSLLPIFCHFYESLFLSETPSKLRLNLDFYNSQRSCVKWLCSMAGPRESWRLAKLGPGISLTNSQRSIQYLIFILYSANPC